VPPALSPPPEAERAKRGTENTKPIQCAKKWLRSPVVLKAVTENGLVLMKQNTRFATFAVFAFLAGSSSAIPEQSNSPGPFSSMRLGVRRRFQ
jgi:hypothetical protein